jgi:hypothetical protein
VLAKTTKLKNKERLVLKNIDSLIKSFLWMVPNWYR